nr:hypothetical protein [Tanacetum cinerariifolium]
MPEDIKVPLILERPFFSIGRAKIDVYKRKITLRVGEEKIIFKSVKSASSIIKRVYMLSLRERMELDLEARLMRVTLMLNRSLDPFSEDYIELYDLNEPFELRRNQGDDLMPTIEKGEVIEEFRTRSDDLDTGIYDYPSYSYNDKKIHIDYAHNLKFLCMIRFEFTHSNFFPLVYVNVMSREFHNSIMKNKMVYKGNNIVGALINLRIFVGTFYVMTDFAILEDMDAYCDKEMGDVIFGEPFLRDVGIKIRRFHGMIAIYNGNDEVTYQMVRSRPRFKNHTNEQCNKIPPSLKVRGDFFYNGLDIPTRQILNSRGAVPTMTAADAKRAIQEMAEYSQKWHNETSRGRSTETSDELAAIQAQLNNLGREIKKVKEKVYDAQVRCEQLYVNVMSKEFHNSIMKNKMVYKGNNTVGALINLRIFVGTFYVMTDFAILEYMDAYCDKEMGDVIFGEPFLRDVEIKTRRFHGMIAIYNGNDEDLVEEKSTNIGGEFSNLEDLVVLES